MHMECLLHGYSLRMGRQAPGKSAKAGHDEGDAD